MEMEIRLFVFDADVNKYAPIGAYETMAKAKAVAADMGAVDYTLKAVEHPAGYWAKRKSLFGNKYNILFE